MNIFKYNKNKTKNEKPPDSTILLNTSRGEEPCGEQTLTSRQNLFEYSLYDALRQSVPVIDAALLKIVRLIGGLRVVVQSDSSERFSVRNSEAFTKETQSLIDNFVSSVPVGTSGTGLQTFIDTYFDSLITYGNAVGEMVYAQSQYHQTSETGTLLGLYNGNVSSVEVKASGEPFGKQFFLRTGENKKISVKSPERILFSALSPKPGDIYGQSVLHGLHALSKTLLKIYKCIGQNYERSGNVRYAVIYKPPADAQSYAKERAEQIAKEWSDGMRAAAHGEVRDFIAAGDVEIKVIGAENALHSTEIPVRQILEQLVAKLSIPPFLLGLNWNTSERMSKQQCDILTSELEFYRRILTPVIIRICKAYLNSLGIDAPLAVEWDTINLQDEKELAEARLANARAREIESQLPADK